MPLVMKGFDETLAKLERFEERLAAPRDFFASKAGEWQRTARGIALHTIIALRPQEADAAEWRQKANRVADRVTADVSLWGNSLILGLDTAPSAVKSVPSVSSVTLDDIREWIRAGLRGEEGGKDITPGDEETIRRRGIDAVAHRVRMAYYSKLPVGAYGRLRRAIQRYLVGEGTGEMDPLLDAVATAWEAAFTPVFHRDLSAWVAARCREF